MINLQSVSKTYRLGLENVHVLKDISLFINQGDFLAIMGPSGSGKSTLMNIIGCLDQPTAGTYQFEGNDITAYNDVELSKVRNQFIGFVFQQFQLLPRLTALKNVELPMIYAGFSKKERKEMALHALTKVGLANRVHHLPNELSGGQKQRVAIARALVNNPRMILADEPTGALDTKTSESIMELLTELNREGTTILIVTHEQEVAAFTQKTIIVRDGEIVNERKEGKEHLEYECN
ncbi:macrolide ABC transporter ATP-binding protein [Anaerobacillus alkalidiazotrophicus]|uniref:Macrolide ABC transporter ATP-binding protein n=1 Tax=Anaerobacillus alkalidiazotrophicus TaxID=472963 RepID=A0A1S2MA92_9BACI|nr:ABC transporter ATP-binding protein [Anaerobacillus alkalidiazotrophicus]OIJ21692.1 macrolide ABC transporter ATP-binding protein [Anaerobacillus alkalidiazotrophicus]